MINHAWTVICEKSIIDRDTNNVSLDVLEQVNFKMPLLPKEIEGIIIPLRVEIVSLWYCEREEKGTKGTGRLRIETPNKKEVANVKIDIDFTSSCRHRTRNRLDGLPVPKETSGYFNFIIEIKSGDHWREVSRVPLEVTLDTD